MKTAALAALALALLSPGALRAQPPAAAPEAREARKDALRDLASRHKAEKDALRAKERAEVDAVRAKKDLTEAQKKAQVKRIHQAYGAQRRELSRRYAEQKKALRPERARSGEKQANKAAAP